MSAPAPVAAARTRILLVDDSPLMRKAATKMLSEEFDVVTAVDGLDAWDQLQADTSLQVVFTDLSMPRLDGYGLLQKIRASEDEGTLNLPVIVVTGADNDDSARRKALDLGATDFITKPFSSIDLLARARAHANYRRITRRLEAQITHDVLTGLANKAGFLDRLQQDIAFARRHAQPLTLVRFEIDDFRNLFLKHGKASAEAVVLHVGRVLHDKVRKEDTAARTGLASFALALPGGQHEGSVGLIERLRAQFETDTIDAAGKPLRITVSASVVTPSLDSALDAGEALEMCERLVQGAVLAGGNRLATQSELMRAPPPTPVAAAVPAPAPAPPKGKAAPALPPEDAPVSVDAALERIERGEGKAVAPQFPQLLQRLLPLLRLLSTRQREQLAGWLQKQGG